MKIDPEEVNLNRIRQNKFFNKQPDWSGLLDFSVDELGLGKQRKWLTDWGKDKRAHRWRWFGTHIDIGRYSVYNLPQAGIGKIFWHFIAWCIKPLRKRWHLKKFGVYSK